MKISKTKEELVNMYIDSLKEGKIPWRERWVSSLNVNGISDKEYKGINQLLLSYVTYKEQYNDNRWFTYYQIKQKGYKLKDAKGKGIPVEFYSVYDIKNKKKVDFADYERLVNERPETKVNYRLICNTSYVFNASLIEGVPEQDKYPYDKSIPANNFIKKIISKLGVKYSERGNEAYYSPTTDEIVLPESKKFYDEYSYYATQLHEISHSTGSKDRLNRNIDFKDKKSYAREELVAEISSSFLMAKLGIVPESEDYNNHKSYIQSWISILEDKPNELFKAINESNKVYDYINDLVKIKDKEIER